MARPKTVDRNEPPVMSDKEIRDAQEKLDAKISAFVDRLIKEEGISKTALARKLGFTQSNISNVFNKNKKSNHWSFPLLIALAKHYDTTVGELIMVSEAYSDFPDSDTVQLFLACSGTKPQTKERLQKLVWSVEGYDPTKVKKDDRFLFELAYNVVQMEIGNPEFCRLYYSGLISDREALAEFNRASEEAHRPEKLSPDNPPLPLWAALQKTWTRK